MAAGQRLALATLLAEVLEIGTAATEGGPWRPFALFAAETCVAALEVAILPLLLDGATTSAAAIRSVAVHPDWRGRGLFRRLMTEALAWGESRTPGPALLYTEDPALYGRFGFRALDQHAFEGAAPPAPVCPGRARRLDLEDGRARDLIRALVAQRAPLSSAVALDVDADLVLTNLAKEAGWSLAYIEALGAAVAYALEGATFVLADVVAPVMPRLAAILGALHLRPARVRVLFPPDRLDWRGDPVREDAGLMIRGPTPPAMTRPFMLPPTAEF